MPEQEMVAGGSASDFAAVGFDEAVLDAGSIPEKWEGRGRIPRGWPTIVSGRAVTQLEMDGGSCDGGRVAKVWLRWV